MQLSTDQIKEFQHTVYEFYEKNKRPMAWRENLDPYAILVSEVMLQQTQVSRVKIKFEEFMNKFPSSTVLAKSELREVLAVWSGLGYNRRAKMLKNAAEVVEAKYKGKIPQSLPLLKDLPGIGLATASAILAYAYNKPVAFIETNIRAVFIHHFFPKKEKVRDDHILPLVQQTLDTKNPREWYWALMDYGTFLKQQHTNPARKSAHHIKQSKFEGSDRQIRGKVLRVLLANPACLFSDLLKVSNDEIRLRKILKELEEEKLIIRKEDFYKIA